MKTSAGIFRDLTWILCTATVALNCTAVRTTAQHMADTTGISKSYSDVDFPSRRQFNAGAMVTYSDITPPPAIVGDMTYGFSGKFSAGIIAGTTGAQSLAGVKLNRLLTQRKNFRMIFRMVVIYYPGRDGQYLFDRSNTFIMPWMLSMAAIDASHMSKKGVRWSLGIGVLETHCVEGMKKYFWGTSEEEKVVPFEVFHTIQASVAIPLSQKLTLRPEVIAVMRDGKLIRKGDFRVFPINPFAKIVYTF